MSFTDCRARAIQKLFKSAIAKIAKQDSWRFERKLRKFSLYFGESAPGHPENVRQAVVVQVDHAVTPTHIPCLNAQAGAQRDIVKLEIAYVLIKSRCVLCKMSFQYIQQTVGIEVPDRDAHSGLLSPIPVD